MLNHRKPRKSFTFLESWETSCLEFYCIGKFLWFDDPVAILRCRLHRWGKSPIRIILILVKVLSTKKRILTTKWDWSWQRLRKVASSLVLFILWRSSGYLSFEVKILNCSTKLLFWCSHRLLFTWIFCSCFSWVSQFQRF